jgi:predicted RNA-binding Zn-ribbon protein involved in translation (DUF1610 family)
VNDQATQVESRVKKRRTTMATATIATKCLYCGLQIPDTTAFCPDCGRPIERGFEIRPIQESELDYLRGELKRKDNLLRLQESELDYLRKELKRKDDLLRQQGFSKNGSGPLAPMEESVHPGNCPECGAPLARRDHNASTATVLITEASLRRVNSAIRNVAQNERYVSDIFSL